MFSPFEELEFLAEYLPDEGETVLVTRQDGELVCQPHRCDDLREGVADPELYGRLVQANERLNAQGMLPLWGSIGGMVAAGILLHGVLGLGWSEWYAIPGIAFLAMYGCFSWIRRRQRQLFRNELMPRLLVELHRRNLDRFSLIAGVRQHAELRTLLDELIHWTPENRHPELP